MQKGEKPPELGDYQCQKCDCRFHFKENNLVCPNCGNSKQDELIPIYLENDPEEEQMYSEADWQGGD